MNQLDDQQLNELFKKELILEKIEKKLIHVILTKKWFNIIIRYLKWNFEG